MGKIFKFSAEEIKPLVEGMGACFASDMITVDGMPVRFMYRQQPDNEMDSGWRFLSGYEDDDYMDNINNHEIYDVNTIANYDPTIIPFLDAEAGLAFEKEPGAMEFVLVVN